MKHQATEKAAAEAVARQAADEAAAKAAAEQAAADAAAQAAEAAKLAEETVNNDSVVELVTAKVPTAVILDHIRDAKVTNFNFSTAELIRLSKAGVSAMIMWIKCGIRERTASSRQLSARSPWRSQRRRQRPIQARIAGDLPTASTPAPAPAPAPRSRRTYAHKGRDHCSSTRFAGRFPQRRRRWRWRCPMPCRSG